MPLLLALVLVSQAPKPIAVVDVPKSARISYANDVAEILDAKCVGCHSSALAENKLKLEDVAGMLKGGKKGPALIPGKADESLIFTMAAHRVEPVMPPKDKKGAEPLTGAELGRLKAWIDAGAKDDSEPDAPARPITLGKLPPGVHAINALDITPDGTRAAVGRANVVTVVDLATGKEILTLGGHGDLVQSVRFARDGSKLAAGGFGEVVVWNVPKAPAPPPAKPEEKKPAEKGKAEEKTKPATDKKVEVAKKAEAPAKPEVWTEARRIGPFVDRVLTIAMSADGKLLATGGGEPSKSGEVKIWNLDDGKLVRSLEGLHSDTVFAVRFSPDGMSLATGSADKFVKVINVADGKEIKSYEGHTHHVLGLDWRPDGKQIVSAGADGALKFWDFATGEQLRSTQGITKAFTAVRWAEDRPKVVAASADGTVKDMNAGSAVVSRAYPTGSPTEYLFAVAVSSDGSKIVAGGSDGVIYQFNGVNGQLIRKVERK